MSNENNHKAGVELEKTFSLKNDFKSPSYDEWKEKVESDLKGASFEKKLITKTYEGIDLQPIYTEKDREDLPFLKTLPGFLNYIRGSYASGYLKDGWEICQEIPYALAEDFNEALHYDIKRGQNSVCLPLDDTTLLGRDADYGREGETGRGGVSISALNSLKRALEGVDLTELPLHIHTGFSSLPFLMLFNAFAKDTGLDLKKVRGSIACDPVGFLLNTGSLPVSFDYLYDRMKLAADWANENAPGLRTIEIKGNIYTGAGASAVQELAFTMAQAVEYFGQMAGLGMEPDDFASTIKFTFGIGQHYFMEIAKLRTAKVLWAKIAEEFGVSEEKRRAAVYAKTSLFGQTKFDPYVNMLRTTTSAFAAVTGGVNGLTVNPFDKVLGLPDEFSRRIARNTQIILAEESHLNNLIDPAGGSYFVEKLTEETANKAWELFKQVEAKGGIVKAVEEGFIQSEIEAVNEKRNKDSSKRKNRIVGTNMYANAKEGRPKERPADYKAIYNKRAEYLQKFRVAGESKKHSEVIDKLQKMADEPGVEIISLGTEAALAGATIGEISNYMRAASSSEVKAEALKQRRAAELFEVMREAVLDKAGETGKTPSVFLVNMGPLKQHKARADFSRGFFETAGLEVIYPDGFESPEKAAVAAVESGAGAAVICSTDDTYPELVPPVTKAIKDKKPDMPVILAGYPKDQIDDHKKAGVDDFIFLGADVYSILSNLLTKMGVLK